MLRVRRAHGRSIAVLVAEIPRVQCDKHGIRLQVYPRLILDICDLKSPQCCLRDRASPGYKRINTPRPTIAGATAGMRCGLAARNRRGQS